MHIVFEYESCRYSPILDSVRPFYVFGHAVDGSDNTVSIRMRVEEAHDLRDSLDFLLRAKAQRDA